MESIIYSTVILVTLFIGFTGYMLYNLINSIHETAD